MAAAGRTVERIDGLSSVGEDLARSLPDRTVGKRVLVVHATVHLATRRAAEVVALVGELSEVAQRIAAGRDRLGLERFELRVGAGAELPRHDTAQVLLDRQLVHQVQAPAVVQVDLQPPAIAPAFPAHTGVRGRLEDETAALDAVALAPMGELERRLGQLPPFGDDP